MLLRSKVLLAADNATMRLDVQSLLSSDYEVQTVDDSDAVLAIARRSPPALMLVNVSLPRLTGFGLLHVLQNDPRTRSIPVILLSEQPGQRSRVEGLEAGAHDFLIQPFDDRELLARVRSGVELSRTREKLVSDLALMTRLNEIGARSLTTSGLESLLEEVLDATMTLLGADFGNVQLYDPKIHGLKIVAQRGAPDVQIGPAEGYRAMQSTPMLSREGELLGMISTHFRKRRQPSERELRMADLYARQAAEMIERKQREALLTAASEDAERRAREAEEAKSILQTIMEYAPERPQAEEGLLKLHTELTRVTRSTIIGELAVSIAHEINQPLGAIVNNSNVCLRLLAAGMDAQDGLTEALQDIVHDANRASAIIARIRALTKRTTLEKIPLQIKDVVADVVSLVQREWSERRTTIRIESLEDLPIVAGDRIQLQQVLLNLVMNACESMIATPEAHRIITIYGQRDELEGRPAVLINVRDVGVGFRPEDVERLFDAFFTTKPEGTGMGLRISRSIVEMHGGRLWATLNDGPGATFRFALPCAEP